MDTDNTRGAAEPVAWMVEWTDHADFFLHRPDAEMVAAGDMAVQSLYRSPTLTDEEREAIEELRILAREHRPNSDRVKGYSYTVERFLRRTK